MAKKVLWLSQHDLFPRQIAALRLKFGADVEVRQDVNPFTTAREVERRFREGGYDEMMFVGPLSVLDQLCQKGLNPWKAEVVEVPRAQAEWVVHGQGYRFVSFKKVAGVEIKYIPGEEFSDTKRRGEK